MSPSRIGHKQATGLVVSMIRPSEEFVVCARERMDVDRRSTSGAGRPYSRRHGRICPDGLRDPLRKPAFLSVTRCSECYVLRCSRRQIREVKVVGRDRRRGTSMPTTSFLQGLGQKPGVRWPIQSGMKCSSCQQYPIEHRHLWSVLYRPRENTVLAGIPVDRRYRTST